MINRTYTKLFTGSIRHSFSGLQPSDFSLLHAAPKHAGQASIEMVFVVLFTFFFIMADLFFNTIMTTAEFYSWQIRSVVMREYAIYRDSFFDAHDDTDGSIGFKTAGDTDLLRYTIKDTAGVETSISVSALVDGWAAYFNPSGEFHVRYGSVMEMVDEPNGSVSATEYDAFETRVKEQDTDPWDMPSQYSRLKTLIDAETTRQGQYNAILAIPDRNVWKNNQ